jgi:hypothetical protein
MKNMMEQMQKFRACMSKIDSSKIEQFEKRSDQVTAEIGAMCASGERDEAQKKAISFGREMSNNTEIKKMEECLKLMKDVTEPKTFGNFLEDLEDEHICDNKME